MQAILETTIKTVIKKLLSEEVRQKMDIAVPQDIHILSDIFKQHGKPLFLVGGCVRDALLGKPPKDWDIVTTATPDEVITMLEPFYKIVPKGKVFGIVSVIMDGEEYEIATARTESGYSDQRRPDKIEFSDFESDSKRRDLGFNALYYDIDKHEIIDYVNGLEDIKNNVVKAVGNPKDRFEEDHLRKLRVLRFASRMGASIDQNTEQAILDDNSLNVSPERIRDEFLKGIKSAKSVIGFFQLIEKFGFWQYIFPGQIINKNYLESKSTPIVLSILLKDNDPSRIYKVLNLSKYSAEEATQISFLLRFQSLGIKNAYAMKKAFKNSHLTKEDLVEFADYANMDQPLVEAFNKYELAISGDNIRNFKGKELGVEITRLETENFKEILDLQ